MEDIVRQVAKARFRLHLEQFFRLLPWTLFTALIVACIGLAIPKVWVMPWAESARAWNIWFGSWLGGTFVAGIVAALVGVWLKRRSTFEAAVEVDRRFGLKERVASSLALSLEDKASPMGQALLEDAARRVGQVEVEDKFQVGLRWTASLPAIPLVCACLLALVANATAPPPKSMADDSDAKKAREQIRKSAEELRKKLAEQKDKAETKGLADADDLFKKLQEGVEQLKGPEQVDRKTALMKLNDLSQELQQKRGGLEAAEQMRKQLSTMKDFQQGPAEKFGKALQGGDFKKAMNELKDLQQQLKDGKMSEEAKKELAKQLSEMKQKMQEAVQQKDQEIKDLENQLRQKQDAGDLNAASKLQEQLDQAKRERKQMESMNKMAQDLQKAAEALEQGDSQKAADQLAQMSDQLQEMQSQLDQMETVDEMMNEIADAKSAMNCKECDGKGCKHCEGDGDGKGDSMGKFSSQKNGRPGRGLGEGRGIGERPEEDVDGKFFDTKARTKMKAGEAVRSGFADGPNLAGKSVESVRGEIVESLKSDPDALPDQTLSRAQREQARQFFEAAGKRK